MLWECNVWKNLNGFVKLLNIIAFIMKPINHADGTDA